MVTSNRYSKSGNLYDDSSASRLIKAEQVLKERKTLPEREARSIIMQVRHPCH